MLKPRKVEEIFNLSDVIKYITCYLHFNFKGRTKAPHIRIIISAEVFISDLENSPHLSLMWLPG